MNQNTVHNCLIFLVHKLRIVFLFTDSAYVYLGLITGTLPSVLTLTSNMPHKVV